MTAASQHTRGRPDPALTVLPSLAAVVDRVPTGLLLLAEDGSAVEVNDAWARLSRIPVADSLGAGWLQAVDASDRLAVRSLVHDAAATGLAGSADVRLMTGGADVRSRWWWGPGPAGTLIVSVALLADSPVLDAGPVSDPPVSHLEARDPQRGGRDEAGPSEVAAELADGVVQRIFGVGLVIQSCAEGAGGSGRRLRQAAGQLDCVIRDIRSIVFNVPR